MKWTKMNMTETMLSGAEREAIEWEIPFRAEHQTRSCRSLKFTRTQGTYRMRPEIANEMRR